MTWTRLSDDFADHPDLTLASRSARLLHVEALVYCNRHGNDGRFRRGLVARMTDAEDWPDLVDELVKLEIWDELAGVLTIDWQEWAQEPAAVVKERRETNAEANRIYRERAKKHRAGDHSMCTSRCPAKSRDESRDQSRGGSRENPRDPYPSRPLPSRPGGEGKGGRDGGRRPLREGSADSAAAPPVRGATPWDYGRRPTVTVLTTSRS